MLLVFLHVHVLFGSGFSQYFLNLKEEAKECEKHWSEQTILINYHVSVIV
jgi:hypothetical protein